MKTEPSAIGTLPAYLKWHSMLRQKLPLRQYLYQHIKITPYQDYAISRLRQYLYQHIKIETSTIGTLPVYLKRICDTPTRYGKFQDHGDPLQSSTNVHTNICHLNSSQKLKISSARPYKPDQQYYRTIFVKCKSEDEVASARPAEHNVAERVRRSIQNGHTSNQWRRRFERS